MSHVEYPKKYHDYLVQQIRTGKIKHDNHIVFATIDDIVQIMRIDTIPLAWFNMKRELEEV